VSKGGSVYSRTILGASTCATLPRASRPSPATRCRRIDLGGVKSNGYSFQIELTYRAVLRGMRVAEVPILFVDRRAGKSKMSRKIFAEAVVMVWKLRFDALIGRLR
jgi:dolichol-phosphate mannosyltransferase